MLVLDFPHGTLIDETRLGHGSIKFFNGDEQDEKKRYGKAQDDQYGDEWVFLHLSTGRQLRRNGRGELVVINTRIQRIPVEGERVVYYSRRGDKGYKAVFWAFETDLGLDGIKQEQSVDDDSWADTLFRVVLRTYHRSSDGGVRQVHESILWEGSDPLLVPKNVWDPNESPRMEAGDTIFEKGWQRKDDWTDCPPPF